MPLLPHSPAPIDAVVTVFGLILGLAVARTLPQLVSFYAWFSRSGLEIAKHRGYGQSGCKMFGFIPAPKLSVVAMALSGVSFLALVLAPIWLPTVLRAPALGMALVAYHLYFSQVYCEAHVGAHVIALIPPALILLALCPALDGDLPPIAAAQTAAFTCWLMKVVLTSNLNPDPNTNPNPEPNPNPNPNPNPSPDPNPNPNPNQVVLTSAYCGAGLCKISKSIASLRRGGSSWCTGSTLQAFIFEAMLLSTPETRSSFGVPTPFTHAMQRLHVLHPRLLLLPASVAAVCFETLTLTLFKPDPHPHPHPNPDPDPNQVCFETLAPLLLLAPPHLASVPFAIAGLSFHYGIALLQNIDFVSWWVPAYAFLLADPAAWAGGGLFASPTPGVSASLGMFASTTAALEVAPLRASLALAYVAVHLVALVVLRWFPNVEMLPLSAFPMFGSPQNVFDRKLRKHVWLTTKPHATGTLKNYAFPFCRAHTITVDELGQLPFDYLLLGHGGDAAKVLHSNVTLTPRLQAALGRIESLGDQEAHTFATDADAAPALLDALDEAKAAFHEAGLAMAGGMGEAGRGTFDAVSLKVPAPGTLPGTPPASGVPRQRTRQRGPASKDPPPRP